MTRIDFYIRPEAELSARLQFACKLIQKTYKLGHRIYIICATEEQMRTLDDLLWSFKEQSFVPHKTGNEHADSDILLVIDDGAEPPSEHHDLLLNLSAEIPPWFSRFERVAEIVVQDDSVLDATRANYRQYSDKNYPLHRHDMR